MTARHPLRPTNECRKVSAALTTAVDGGPIDLTLRRHVRTCASCRRRLADQHRLVGMLRMLETVVPLPPRVDRRARTAKRVGAGSLGVASLAAFVFHQVRKRP
jgi:hypothetical protein